MTPMDRIVSSIPVKNGLSVFKVKDNAAMDMIENKIANFEIKINKGYKRFDK